MMRAACDHDDYRSYDRRPVAWSSKRGLTTLAFYALSALVVFFVFNSAYNAVFKPYMKFWDDRVDLVEQSRAYLHDPRGLCAQVEKSDLRLKIPEYDQCRVAERRLKSSPTLDAFTDLMEYLQFCAGGQCMVFSVNIVGFLGWIFWGFTTCGLLIILAVGSFVATICYRNLQAGYALPLHADPVQHALQQQRQAHALQQQRQAPQNSYEQHLYEPQKYSPNAKLNMADLVHQFAAQHGKQQ